MYAIVDNLVLLALVVVVATGTVSGHQQIIYVDTQNGTLNSSCWDCGTVMPCANLKLALEGAQKRHNAAVALLLKTTLMNPETQPVLLALILNMWWLQLLAAILVLTQPDLPGLFTVMTPTVAHACVEMNLVE